MPVISNGKDLIHLVPSLSLGASNKVRPMIEVLPVRHNPRVRVSGLSVTQFDAIIRLC